MVWLSMWVVVVGAAPAPEYSWSALSPDGKAQLTQTALPDDACQLECTLAGKPSWTFSGCLGRKTDFNFVSNDCATALSLLEYPLKKATPATTPVALALLGGTTTRTFFFGQLGASTRGEGKRLRWLAGVVGEPGVKPHLDASETGVEFMLLDGTVRRVRFANIDDFIPQRAAAPAAQAQATGGMYQFTAGDGSTHFVMGLDQVPKKFRKSARPVESEVGVVQGAPPSRTTPTPFASTTEVRPTQSRPLPAAAPAPKAPAAPGNGCIYGLNMTTGVCNALMGVPTQQTVHSLPPAEPPKPPPSPYK